MSTKNKQKHGRQAIARQKVGEVNHAHPSSSSSSSSSSSPPVTLESALESIEMLIEQSDLRAAEQALRSSNMLGQMKPTDVQAHHAPLLPAFELLAQVLIGSQRIKEAFGWLRACCQLQPDGGSEKWMYYGQLIGGPEALEAYKRGIACMFKQRQVIVEKHPAALQREASNAFTLGEHETTQQLDQQLRAIDKQISSGYTSMSELYVTDLW